MGVFFCYALTTGGIAMSFQNWVIATLESYAPSILPDFETTTNLTLYLRA